MYPSEIKLPITRDTLSFEERHRRSRFDDDIDRLRSSFIRLKSFDSASSPRTIHAQHVDMSDDSKMKGDDEARMFRVRFDVDGFNPEEIKVTTDRRHVIVTALHREKKDRSTVTKEFRRQVDLPANVSPESVSCVLSTDGVLSLEAPLNTPSYSSLKADDDSRSDLDHFRQSSPPSYRTVTTTTREPFTSRTVTSTREPFSRRTITREPLTSRQPITRTYKTETVTKSVPYQSGPGRILREERISRTPGYISHTSSSPAFSHSSLLHDDSFEPISTSTTGPNIVEEDGVRKMKIVISSFNFKPEELKLKTHDRTLNVSATHEEVIGGRTSSRQFCREYDLPTIVDPNDVSAYMTTAGELVIEAPVKHQQTSQQTTHCSVKVSHE